MAHEAGTKYLTTREAARILGFTPETLRRWDAEGHFKPSRRSPNGVRYYRLADVEAFAEKLEAV